MSCDKGESVRTGNNTKKGRWGEELAAGYLIDHGYQIVFRNFYSKFGELDIVAKKRGVFIFIEVKTRTNNRYGTPAEAVDAQKRKHMENAAKFFVQRFGIGDVDMRFDVVEVTLNHLENI